MFSDFIDSKVKELTNEIISLRCKLSLAVEASGVRIADLGREIATKEAALALFVSVQNAPKNVSASAGNADVVIMADPYEIIMDVISSNLRLDDTYSGRGNDVRRAVFDAELRALQECQSRFRIMKSMR